MHRRPARCLILSSTLVVAGLGAGCTQFPDLDARNGPDMAAADYPLLVPIDGLLAGVGTGAITATTDDEIAARAARLRARADRLRGSVLDNGTRRRMDSGVSGV